MADGVRITIKGMEEFKRKLAKMEYVTGAYQLLDVVDAGAKVAEGGMKRRAPVDTGALRASIHTEIDEISPNYVSINVGPSVHYAIHQEFGTRYMKGHPFMRPTIDEDRSKIGKAMENIIKMKLESAL